MRVVEPISPGSKTPKDKRDRSALKRSSELMTKSHPCGKFQQMLDEELKKVKRGANT